MKVAVGSANPTKLEAVKQAFTTIFPKTQFIFETVAAPSKIADQPMRDRESIKGATNRAKYALKHLKADFGVGLEGGLNKIGNDWFETGWIVVVDKQGTKGVGSAIRVRVPEAIMKHIHDGEELGTATDLVFKDTDSKSKKGFFGHMTGGTINRASGYRDGVISALSRFLHPKL